MKKILNKIYDFCKVKEESFRTNTEEYSNRLNYLISLVSEFGINYHVDTWDYEDVYFHNLVLEGDSDKVVIAHYDIVNVNSDNANDNSASVINAIALKTIAPDVNIILTDGEEFFDGEGAKRIALLKSSGYGFYKNIRWILNLELTGYGDKICVSDYQSNLQSKLYQKLNESSNIIEKWMPRNDTSVLIPRGIDSVCVTLCPSINGEATFEHWYNCHSTKDSIDKMNIDDMYNFVNILKNIVQ